MASQCNCASCQGLRQSDAFVMVFTSNGAVSYTDTSLLGLAVLLDKPIIAVCPPGCKVPDKLAKVVDRFIEIRPDAQPVQIIKAVKEALIDMGVDKPQDPRPPYDTEPSHN